MHTLIITRHGESVFSAERRANGDPARDTGLTPAGQEQARALGVELANIDLDLCLTSEFPRAIETARLVLGSRGVPSEIDAGLNDIRYGYFEGDSLDRSHAWMRQHPVSDAMPGGESELAVLKRCEAVLHRIAARPEGTILVVTHDLLVSSITSASSHPGAPATHKVPYATPYTLDAAAVERACVSLAAHIQRTDR